jgi:hypothetical protein
VNHALMVIFIEEPKERALNELLPNQMSIIQFLNYIDWYSLLSYIEENGYSKGGAHFRYDPLLMLKLIVVKCFRRLSYRDTIASLSEEDCRNLGVSRTEDGYHLPAHTTLHHFVKYRLKAEGFENLMHIIGHAICRDSGEIRGIIDSTPLEASRYNQKASFNPHYQCRMDKAHIFHLGEFPVVCNISEGSESDVSYIPSLVEAVKFMNPNLTAIFADGGYDSFQVYAQLYYHLKARPYIEPRENAIIHDDGTELRINHWVNRLWKSGGSIHDSIKDKLRFLYAHGREEQVGMYLRNQNLLDPSFRDIYSNRGDCERTHNHIKSIVKFDIRGLRQESKRLYVIMNFVVYQILLLGHLQNNITPAQHFTQYF